MPVIALLTDFGTRDYYVAAMKGVILTIAPGCQLVDITHDIPAQDIPAAAFELAACYRDFPRGTVFLAVVDPGVGTGRKAIAARAVDYFFVAPDNGILAPVLEGQRADIVELTEKAFERPSISSTFEGRDRFAPAAAWLAKGTDIGSLGTPVTELVQLQMKLPQKTGRGVEGTIFKVDHFGNLVSNIDARMVEMLGAGARASVEGRDIGPLVRTYAEALHGAPCALVGSSGYVEISVNGGSAAQQLGLGKGARIDVFA